MDVNQAAFLMVRESTSSQDGILESSPPTKSEISRIMAEMGRKGGLIGGKRRLKTMTKKERSEIASKAASVRWKKAKSSSK
jgi:hypothetical protein